MGFYKFMCFFMMRQIQLHPRTCLLFIFCTIPFSFANSSFMEILAIFVMLSSHLGLIILTSQIRAQSSPLPPIYIYGRSQKRLHICQCFSFFKFTNGDVCILFVYILQNEPAGRILELCILHLAMSEITVLGTRHQIVINEVMSYFPFLFKFAYLYFAVLLYQFTLI